ncbi:MAG: hypothetical protein ACI4GA_06875 [Acutalibacteraceae bacterium]|nr:hypothetical protein [Oscillospiraceae bacterium]
MKKFIAAENAGKTLDRLRYFTLVAGCLVFCVLLTVYAPQSKSGVSAALSVCSKTVIPSLFPFMFLSGFMIESGVFNRSFKLLDRLSTAVFKQPQCALSVFAMSIIGGFPIGGKMTKQLYEKGYLTQNQAQRLLLFCVNPGPAFTVSVLGLSFLGEIKLGYIIYASIIFSNLVIAVLSRFLSDCEESKAPENLRPDIYSAFVRSGSGAAASIVSVCTFVLIFSCLGSILECLTDNDTAIDVISGALEVTTGCERLAVFSSAPLLAGVTAWGGISVHCQIADCIRKTGLDIKLFLTSRILSAAISLVSCDLLLKIFPVEISALAANAGISPAVSESSFPVSVAMLLTSCAFLIGDHSFKSKRKC